jgi:hypothetical protein
MGGTSGRGTDEEYQYSGKKGKGAFESQLRREEERKKRQMGFDNMTPMGR